MNKEEIKSKLIQSGLINRFKPDPLWVSAFEIYNAENKAHLKPSCGSCFNKVKTWLLK